MIIFKKIKIENISMACIMMASLISLCTLFICSERPLIVAHWIIFSTVMTLYMLGLGFYIYECYRVLRGT
jgi:hypothetical protein